MAVDGTLPKVFNYTVPEGRVLGAARFIFYLSSNSAFAETTLGHLPALENGIQINLNGTEIDCWKDNIDIYAAMFDYNNPGFTKPDKSLGGRWTLAKATNDKNITVRGGGTVSVVIRDDLSGLDIFRMRLQGELSNS